MKMIDYYASKTIGQPKTQLVIEAVHHAVNYANMLYARSGGRVAPTSADIDKWETRYVMRQLIRDDQP